MALRVGIDVGGTFTDLFLHDSASGRFWIGKTPSTPSDQSIGVLEGIREIAETAAIPAGRIEQILHGTTVATNAVLEGKGARVGLLITEGWSQLLHLAESQTPGPLFGFFSYVKPDPLVDYEDIREIPERLDAKGELLKPLDEPATRVAVRELREAGVQAITICLLNSYANGDHERRVKAIALEELAGSGITVSSSVEITPEFREYERATTTVMNSYIGPILQRYLGNLEAQLVSGGITAPVQVVRSDGGLMSVAAAHEHPVQTVLSGPSGGVNGAAFVAHRAGFDKIMTFDMGGTSTDAAVSTGGEPTVTRETRVGPFPVRAPSVEVETIGAGGGSIANVSEVTGALRVGPQSAGAAPGPACYGRGGTLPTVTDANVVLGHLPPTLLGGKMKLDVEAAHRAVQTIADQMGVDVHRAAEGIIAIVNENMLGALRVVSVQKGLDPTDFALVAFGGAGGLHANAMAEALHCYPVIIPRDPGVLSALGFIVADIRNEFGTTFITTTERTTMAEIQNVFDGLGALARDWLAGELVAAADQHVSFLADMRYYRQGFELPIETAGATTLDKLADRFRAVHDRLYGFGLPGAVELVNLRARAVGRVTKPELAATAVGGSDASAARTGEHQGVPLYERELLQPGMELHGKAIVTQFDATTLILPGHVARVDRHLNLLIDPEGK